MWQSLTSLPLRAAHLQDRRAGLLAVAGFTLLAINFVVQWLVHPLLALTLTAAFAVAWSLYRRWQQAQRQQYDFALHVMETMGQGLTITNAAGQFEYVNTAYARMLGCTPADLLGVSPETQTHPDDLELVRAGHTRRLRHASDSYEVRLGRADGDYIYVLVTAVPYYRSGQIIGSIAVITDLSTRQQLEQTMRAAHDQALEAANLKSEFLATMSHEIRTPMNGILGMSELLLETPLNDEQREFARIVQSEAHALLTVINDILDFSKIEAGKMRLESTELVLVDVLERIVEFMNPLLKGKNLVITSSIAPDVPFSVKGDPTRLRQILFNLVSNAVKFTPDGEITLRLTVEKRADQELMLRFAITDTGIGLSEAARKRLFQPFAQADSSTTRKYGGTGLGLAISKRLTELMGGEIGVESVEGQGSTFWFTARFEGVETQPGKDAVPAVVNVRKPPQKTAPLSKLDMRPLVLVVDDNIIHVELTRRQLERQGCRVEVANNGQVALDMLAAVPERYALVLMDCEMPVLNGYEAVRRLRQREAHKPHHLPVIAVTASALAEDQARCREAGMDDIICKPLQAEHLRRALEQWVSPLWL